MARELACHELGERVVVRLEVQLCDGCEVGGRALEEDREDGDLVGAEFSWAAAVERLDVGGDGRMVEVGRLVTVALEEGRKGRGLG